MEGDRGKLKIGYTLKMSESQENQVRNRFLDPLGSVFQNDEFLQFSFKHFEASIKNPSSWTSVDLFLKLFTPVLSKKGHPNKKIFGPKCILGDSKQLTFFKYNFI